MAATSKPNSVTDKIVVEQIEVKPRAGGSVLADAAVKSGKPAAQVKRKKDEEDELQNLKDDVGATAEDVAGELVDGQEGAMLLAQAETSGAAGSTGGGGAAGTGAAAGSATGAEAAGAAALSDAALGTIILGSFVGVAVIASTGGSSAAAVAPAATGFALTGTVVAGAVIAGHGLTVEAFKADGTQLAGGAATVGNTGTFTMNITENYSGPVLVRVVDTSAGNDYTDEGTGNPADLTVDLRVMVNVSGNGTITVNVTPVTELAVRELAGDAGGDGGTSVTTLGATVTTTQVTAANTAVQNALGLTSDIVSTAPITVDVSATPNAYGQVLAAIAGAEANLGAGTGTVLNTLAQGISQGISGSTLDQSVVDLLLAGATTADNVVSNLATNTATALTTLIGSNISAIDISADTGSATDFITQTAAQTITATLDAALGTNKLWGSVDDGATWTDVSSFLDGAGTGLTWTGVTLSGSSSIKLAVTASTVTSFTGAAADVVGNISVQSYSVDATAPAFTSATAANFAENGTATAYTAAATDAHLLAYTKSGADTALFNLDPNSGAVTFISAPNFEAPADAGGDNVYNITVTATDGAGNATNQAVAITVTNVNEMPTLTSGAAASFAENATGTVYTATATDPEAAALTYALGGTDAARFAINANTGAVTFAAAPNFEAPTDAGSDNVYNITVTASDGTNTTSAQAVAITVTDVNETPVITSVATANFAENGTGTVYTAAATDPEGATLTYALGTTGDNTLFNINSSTGAVTFAATPNFEVPADAGGNNVYDITVTASDGTNTTSAQAVAVTVTNVNEAPALTSGATSTATLAVNQAFSDNVSGLFSDVDAGNVFSYSATGLPTGITLNSTSGVISGTPTATGTVDIVITATDSGGLTASHTVTVNVVTAPVITSIASNVAQAKSGDALIFTATISEVVTVTGTPTLTLDVGGTPMTATYTGGTGTAALTFTATTPAGDDATVTVTAINLNGGSVIGNTTTQPLVDTTTGQVVTAFVVDNSNPVFTSIATASVAENQTAAYTAAVTDATAVTYTLGGTDVALFNINTNTGAVTFATAPNFEVPTDTGGNNVYDIIVTATDALGHVANQNVAVTVTNVNEGPTVASGAPTTDTLVVGQALVGAEVASLFTDVDAGDTLTYSQTGLPAELTLDPSTGAITGTPVTTGTTNITFTATDAGSLSVNHTIAVSVVSAPVISSTIDNVTNFDVTSNIVLTASENVTAVAGKNITIVNDGGTGFHGEATVNTQIIAANDTTKVTITSNTITINPGFDLDLANDYHIIVDAGAFLGVTSGQGSVVTADAAAMNFSTVTPGSAAGGVAGAAASQEMADGTDAMVASYSWWDIETLGSTITSAVSGDLSAGSIAAVFKDYDPLPGDANAGYTGIGSPGDDYVNLLNFGNGDLLYVDNQTNSAPNDLTQAAIVHSGVAPVQLQIDGYTPQGGMPIWVDITTTQGTAAFNDVLTLQTLLGTPYIPIVSA